MTTLVRIDAETLPRLVVLDPPMTDEEFEALCPENDSVQFERTWGGAVRIKPPVPVVGQAVETRRLHNS